MPEYTFAPLGAIIDALLQHNCKLTNLEQEGSLIFETKQQGNKVVCSLQKANDAFDSDYIITRPNTNEPWVIQLQHYINATIKINLAAANNFPNYNAIALRTLHTLDFDANENGEIYKGDNRNWQTKLKDSFKPSNPFFVTYCIMAINLVVFIAMVIYTLGASFLMPNGEVMISWGASFMPLIFEGQYWRLLTSTFLHFGILHIAFNMYALQSMGGHTEYFYKHKLYLAGYITCGIVASIVSIWFNGIQVGAGASGAIFGVLGMLLGFTFTDVLPKDIRMPLLKSLLTTIGINVMLTISSSFIDNSAHIGGLLCGILISFMCYKAIKTNFASRYVNMAYIGMVAIVVIAAFTLVPRALMQYKQYAFITKQVDTAYEAQSKLINTLFDYEEHYDRVFAPVVDKSIKALSKYPFYLGYQKMAKIKVGELRLVKKQLYFYIASNKNENDSMALDSFKFYNDKIKNGD